MGINTINTRDTSEMFKESSENYCLNIVEKLTDYRPLRYFLQVLDPKTIQNFSDNNNMHVPQVDDFEKYYHQNNNLYPNELVESYLFYVAENLFPHYDKIPDSVENALNNYFVPSASKPEEKYKFLTEKLIKKEAWASLLVMYKFIENKKGRGDSAVSQIKEQLRTEYHTFFNSENYQAIAKKIKNMILEKRYYDAGALLELYKMIIPTKTVYKQLGKELWSFIFNNAFTLKEGVINEQR